MNTKRLDSTGAGMCRQVVQGPRKQGDMGKHEGGNNGRGVCVCVCFLCGWVSIWGVAEPRGISVYPPPLTCSAQHSLGAGLKGKCINGCYSYRHMTARMSVCASLQLT